MEFIDSYPVTSYRIRFTDRAEVDEHGAEMVRDGQHVIWLVNAICQPPSYHPTSKGSDDRYRLNVQKVVAAAPLTGDLREQALAYIDHGGTQTYLSGAAETRLPFEDGFTHEADIRRIRLYLAEIGELSADEPIADTIIRLLERRLNTANHPLLSAEAAT